MAKYRHSYHAGNFADVHKHLTLFALLSCLKRKDKGFAYFETHAGRGAYNPSPASTETAGGAERLLARGVHQAPELREFATLVSEFRLSRREPNAYPGSPVIAAHELRPQDRAVLCELNPAEARALERQLEGHPRMRVQQGDGFERLRAWMPPAERRGLVLIDPPYEETHDLERVALAVSDALRRFSTGVYAIWYPIKDQRETRAWLSRLGQTLGHAALAAELWLYPRDSRVALNGSGLLIVNPPWLLAERMEAWLPELQALLDTGHQGGTSITKLTAAA